MEIVGGDMCVENWEDGVYGCEIESCGVTARERSVNGKYILRMENTCPKCGISKLCEIYRSQLPP